MVQAFSILLVCQLLREGMVHLTSIPIPGPVLGLTILASVLAWRERRPGIASLRDMPLGTTATGLLSHLSLLFVPADVGVVQQGAVLKANGAVIVLALVASTTLTLAVTAAQRQQARYLPLAQPTSPVPTNLTRSQSPSRPSSSSSASGPIFLMRTPRP